MNKRRSTPGYCLPSIFRSPALRNACPSNTSRESQPTTGKMRQSASAQCAGFLALALCAACAGKIPPPTAAQIELARQRWPAVSPADLERGRSLYIARCGGCHNLFPPVTLSAVRWPEVLERMAAPARLTAVEREEVGRYLLAVTARPP